MIIQQLRAKNDANGNPRRLWVAYGPHDGLPCMVEDEGYRGYPSDRFGPRSAHVELPSIAVSVTTYREWIAQGRRIERMNRGA